MQKSVVCSFYSSALPVTVTKELESQTAAEGESVTLHCELSKPCVPVEWRKGELGLCPCTKYEIRQTGCLATLVIHDVDKDDAGCYTCDTGYHQSTAQVAVKGTLALNFVLIIYIKVPISFLLTQYVAGYKTHQFSVLPNFLLISFPAAQPVLFKTKLQNLENQAGESASLRCETTKPGANVIWRYGDRVLTSSSKYHLKQEGTVVELIVFKLQGADAGEYSCDTGSQRTSASLTVKGRVSLHDQHLDGFITCTFLSHVFLLV